MKTQQIIFIFTITLISSFLASMHHENSNNFAECKGKVGNLYVSKIPKSGTVQGFKTAVNLHQKFYTDRGYDVRVIPRIVYEREENVTIEKPFRFNTVVIFPSMKVREQWGKKEFTEKDQKEFNAFLDIYNENSEVVLRRSVCYLD